MSSKGQSTLITTSLYIGIIVTATIGITTYMSPVVDDLTDSQTIQQMLDAMPEIEETIRSVADSGEDSQQTFSLSFREGSFDIDAGDDELSFTIDSGAGIISPGTSRSFGNVQLSAGATVDINTTTVNGTPCWQVSNTHVSACIQRIDDPVRSLLGFYTFEDDRGQVAVDDAGYSNDGYLGNAQGEDGSDPQRIGNCVFGDCLLFDGADDRVTIPNDGLLSPTRHVTVSAWVRQDGTSSNQYQRITDRGNGLVMWVDDQSQDVCVRLTATKTTGGSQTCFSQDIEQGTWYNLAFTYSADTNETRLYVDGDHMGMSTEYVGEMNPGTDDLVIGNNAGNSRGWVGAIDHVAVYNHTMTPAEVDARYRTGTVMQAYREDLEPVMRYTNTDTGIDAADPEMAAHINANTSSRTGFVSTSVNDVDTNMPTGTVSTHTKSMTGIDYRTDFEVLSGADFLSVSVDED